MKYAEKLKKGDKVAIVSLSSGMVGEEFCSHNIEIGVKRLKEYGLLPVFMPNARKGITYLKAHPEARAQDLKDAFSMTRSGGSSVQSVALKETGVFDVVHGVLVGKPQDEAYYEAYKSILTKVIDNERLPVVYNVNFGHATPRCVLQYGAMAKVDMRQKKIYQDQSWM